MTTRLTAVVQASVLALMYNTNDSKLFDNFHLLEIHTSFLEQLSFVPIKAKHTCVLLVL